MTDYSLNDRWQENRNTWKAYWNTFTLDNFAIALIIFAVMIVGFGYFNQHGGAISWTNIFGDFYANVSSELISIVITVLVLERLNNRRQDKQELTRLKALLGSNEAVITKIAVAELGAKGWLYDGSLLLSDLVGANMEQANLRGANLKDLFLSRANMKNTNLEEVKFDGSSLIEATLTNSHLNQASFKRAILRNTDFKETDLRYAEFEDSSLDRASFEQADIRYSNFKGVTAVETNFKGALLCFSNFEGAYLLLSDFEDADLSYSTLPDGTLYKTSIDIERFTNLEHPEYKSTKEKIAQLRKKNGYEVH